MGISFNPSSAGICMTLGRCLSFLICRKELSYSSHNRAAVRITELLHVRHLEEYLVSSQH